jgi:PST family polysaccharide transporter
MLKLLQAMASTGGASLISQFLGILTNKILAVTMGPAGVGIYGLYRQLLDTTAALASVGSGGGMVQGVSSTEGEARLRRLKAAMTLNALSIMLSALTLIVLAPLLAEKYLVRAEWKVELIILCMGIPLALVLTATMLWNLVSISREYRLLAILMVTPAVASLIVAFPFASMAAQDNQWGYFGMMVAPFALQFALAVPIVRRLGWLKEIRAALSVTPATDDYWHFVRIHATAVLSYLASFVVFLVLPPLIVINYGLDANGYFRAAYTLSLQGLAIVLASTSAYLFPVMSGAKTEEERQQLFENAGVVVFTLVIPIMAGIILFQPLVIRILFDKAFLPSIDMLQWMLIGNYFRALHWLFMNVSTTRAHMTLFTVTETAFWLMLLAFGYLAVAFPAGQGPIPWLSGIEGIGMTFFGGFAVIAAVSVTMTWRTYGTFMSPRLTLLWFIGLAIIVACSVLTWRSRTVDWPVAIGMSLLASATPLIVILDASRRAQLRELWEKFRGRENAG